jgi:beta-lactamase class A
MQPRRIRHVRTQPKRLWLWIIAGFVIIIIVLLTSQSSRLANVVESFAPKPKIVPITQTKSFDQVNDLIESYKNAAVSVSLIDLGTGVQTSFGSSKALLAASVTKVATAADFLHEVELGKASLSQQISGYPASWQLQQMIQQSNNDSWNALDNLLGYQQLADYAHSEGLTSFDLATNQVTAADEARFFQKLYTDQLLNKKYTNLELSYMQHTNEESYIPAVVPNNLTVHHKYGLLDGSLNDAAIISGGKRPFVLVVFTDGADLTDQAARINLVHQITRAILDYED